MWHDLWVRIKNILKKRKWTAIIALSVAGYYFYKILSRKIPETHLSYFLLALKENGIDEVAVKGKNVYFKAVGSTEWFFTNYSFMSGDLLYRVLSQNPGLKISAVEDRSSELNQLILSKNFY